MTRQRISLLWKIILTLSLMLNILNFLTYDDVKNKNVASLEFSNKNLKLKIEVLLNDLVNKSDNLIQKDLIIERQKKKNRNLTIEFLPHLIGKTNLVQPKFKLSKNREATIAIGIPTIKREKTSYLLETVKSVLDAMNELEKSDALIVIMIATFDDERYIQATIESLSKEFKYELDSGLLEIIVPPNEFYPDFTKIEKDKVFNDSNDRVKWRTKQNYDFSYLMTYGQKRSKYYLQIEDDIITKSGFYTTIKNFINNQKSHNWMMMEFSSLGFIGKLFKCSDLPKFVNFFLIFAADKPVDWLYDSLLDVKICNPEKGGAHCERSKSSLKIKYKPSLFQHIGVQSSLKGKTQKLKDKEFGKQPIIKAHQNPTAKLSTSLKTYMKYTLQSAYLGQNYFWSMAPSKNDYILFEFAKPVEIYKYYIKSGNPEHPDDKLRHAYIQIQTLNEIPKNQLPAEYTRHKDRFYTVNKFSSDLGIVSGTFNPAITGKISKLKINIPESSETWIILSEIDITTTPIPGKIKKEDTNLRRTLRN